MVDFSSLWTLENAATQAIMMLAYSPIFFGRVSTSKKLNSALVYFLFEIPEPPTSPSAIIHPFTYGPRDIGPRDV